MSNMASIASPENYHFAPLRLIDYGRQTNSDMLALSYPFSSASRQVRTYYCMP